jgi:hypothetical protein
MITIGDANKAGPPWSQAWIASEVTSASIIVILKTECNYSDCATPLTVRI